MSLLQRDTIIAALPRLNDILAQRGERGEIFLVGGAVMCLVHQARPAEDAADIRFLADHLGLRSADATLAVVSEYFPAERLPVRVRLLLEELFDDRA